MKKGRLGICLSVLCENQHREALEEILFTETTAIGLRRHEVEKEALERDLRDFVYEGETLSFKRVYCSGKALKYKVEYEDLVRYAQKKHLSILDAQKQVKLYLEADEKWKVL
jgi:uncharacterized protein (DUF111 family)